MPSTLAIVIAAAVACLACAPNSALRVDPALASRHPQYDLDVELTPQKRLLRVSGLVRLPSEVRRQPSLDFRLADRASGVRLEMIAGEVSRDLQTEKIDRGAWTVGIGEASQGTGPLVLRVSYDIAGQAGDRFFLGAPVSFASSEAPESWYPRFEGYTRATGRLCFAGDKSLVVVASGVEERADAAEATCFSVSRPGGFSFAAGPFAIERLDGDPPLALYLLNKRSDDVPRLADLRRIVGALEAEFGALPYPSLAVVEIPMMQAGGPANGYSQEGYVLLAGPAIDMWNLALVSHEAAHQWWADSIKPEGVRGRRMLTEGLAQYGALRVVAALEGEEAAAEFRRTGYPGYEALQNLMGYRLLAAAGHDAPLSDLPPGPLGHNLSTSKGFLVYDLLSRELGGETFRDALHALTRKYAFSDVAWDTFLRELAVLARMDLAPFFAQWFERPGAPHLAVDWTPDAAGVVLTVRQREPHYRAPLWVELRGASKERSVVRVELDGPTTTRRLESGFPVTDVRIDPGGYLPHVTPESLAAAEAVRPFVEAQVQLWNGNPREAESILEAALKQRTGSEVAGSTFLFRVLLGITRLTQNDPAAAARHLEIALKDTPYREEWLPMTYFFRAMVAGMMKDVGAFTQAVEGALAADARLPRPTGWGRAARALRPR